MKPAPQRSVSRTRNDKSGTAPLPARAAAFTLIELLTVIAIVGVLAGIVIGVGRRASETGKIARAKAELAAISAALESYRRHFGDYPQIAADVPPSSAALASGEGLFAALNGQRAPTFGSANLATRQRIFVSSAALTLADPAAADTAANHFVDPWGNPYHYAYNTATNGWKNSSFVLFSAGPDGLAEISETMATTGFIDATVTTANVDNLYANP